jgi:3-deoxy-D-manno-octulosonic-acid transferase
VGELQLLRPLIREYQKRWPDWDIVISSTTITGRKLARESYPDLTTFYSPFDFSWAVKKTLQRIQPNLIVLAELELWPNLLSLARENEIEVAIVNGRLSERSFRGYQRMRWLAQSMLAKLNCIAAQNETYAGRFLDLGALPDAVSVTGSIKFDGANPDRMHPEVQQRRKWAGLTDQHTVWFVGSTQDPEEAMAVEIFIRQRKAFPHLKLIVVPRHAERFDTVAAHLDATGLRVLRRSQATAEVNENWDVLLIDSIGELRWWWGVANLATVGGSFGNRGGQNMIEPCAYGACVSFGPNTRNFRDIVEQLLQHQAATQLADKVEWEKWLLEQLLHPEKAEEQGQIAANWVAGHLGATDRTLDLIEPIVESHGRARTLPFRRQEAA